MKCLICDKETKTGLTLDLDINPIGFCDKHEKEVRFSMDILMSDGEESFKAFINQAKNENI